HSQLAGSGRQARLLLQTVLRPQKKQESFARQSEGVARSRGQILVQTAAGEIQIAQERRRPLGARSGGSAPETNAPGDEVGIQTGPHVEGAFRVPHPPERLPNDAGRRKRDEMAGGDESRIADRAAIMIPPAALEE